VGAGGGDGVANLTRKHRSLFVITAFWFRTTQIGLPQVKPARRLSLRIRRTGKVYYVSRRLSIDSEILM
jgi:hypothetical protein